MFNKGIYFSAILLTIFLILYTHQKETFAQKLSELQSKLNAEIERSKGMDQALVVIVNPGGDRWSADITGPSCQGSKSCLLDRTLGSGTETIPFECIDRFQVVVKKYSEDSNTLVAVVKDGQLLDSEVADPDDTYLGSLYGGC